MKLPAPLRGGELGLSSAGVTGGHWPGGANAVTGTGWFVVPMGISHQGIPAGKQLPWPLWSEDINDSAQESH